MRKERKAKKKAKNRGWLGAECRQNKHWEMEKQGSGAFGGKKVLSGKEGSNPEQKMKEKGPVPYQLYLVGWAGMGKNGLR